MRSVMLVYVAVLLPLASCIPEELPIQELPSENNMPNTEINSGASYNRVDFGSYKPTPDQIEFVRKLLSTHDGIKSVKTLIDILRQSTNEEHETPSEERQEIMDEFDSTPVAEATVSSNDKDRIQDYPDNNVSTRNLLNPPKDPHISDILHNNNNANTTSGIMKGLHPGINNHRIYTVGSDGSTLKKHVSETVYAAPVLAKRDKEYAKAVCKRILDDQEILKFCKSASMKYQVLKSPSPIDDDSYVVTVKNDKILPGVEDVVSTITDKHTINQSIQFVFYKICVGPLIASCQNVLKQE